MSDFEEVHVEYRACIESIGNLEETWSPCDGCEPGYIGACSSCKFASPEINESLRYGDEG